MTILDDIITYKKDEVANAKERVCLDSLERLAGAAPAPKGFQAVIKRKLETGFALIAEIKKASPSKGLIREDFDPVEIARAYERGGATCLSVLTDAPSFQGSPEVLKDVRAISPLPLLRKDFMIDPYQVFEARAWGADCILLIMAVLSDAQARELSTTAKTLQMDVLVETHDRLELERAINLGESFIGVNNRNLNTFKTDLQTTIDLAPLISPTSVVVSESGIFTHDHLERLSEAGANCFLVGESLMRQRDIAAATSALLNGM